MFQTADQEWKKVMKKALDRPEVQFWAEDFHQRKYFNVFRLNNKNFDLI